MTNTVFSGYPPSQPHPSALPSVWNTEDRAKKHEGFVVTYIVYEIANQLRSAVSFTRSRRERLGVRSRCRGADFLIVSGSWQGTYDHSIRVCVVPDGAGSHKSLVRYLASGMRVIAESTGVLDER